MRQPRVQHKGHRPLDHQIQLPPGCLLGYTKNPQIFYLQTNRSCKERANTPLFLQHQRDQLYCLSLPQEAATSLWFSVNDPIRNSIHFIGGRSPTTYLESIYGITLRYIHSCEWGHTPVVDQGSSTSTISISWAYVDHLFSLLQPGILSYHYGINLRSCIPSVARQYDPR